MKAKAAAYILCVMTAAGVMFLQGCKGDTTSEQFPQEKYIIEAEGLRMRSEPSLRGNRLALIPFGEKVTVTGKSGNTMEVTDSTSGRKLQRHWYQVQWNGKKGWVFGAYIGDKAECDNVSSASIRDDIRYIVPEYTGLISTAGTSIDAVWQYPQGQMEKSEMYFYSNGLLVLDSGIFSERKKKYYFMYNREPDKKTIAITFIDTRLDFADIAKMENNSENVWGIDKENKTIRYNVKQGKGAEGKMSICAFGWCFFEQ
ncbi:MAG TPA: SH3 domain-containing protein [Spirochaetota bacterium]|nr:SH3 domain-containing protein [Spirochaetota bacterium]